MRILIFFLMSLLTAGCKTKQAGVGNGCDLLGTVRDFTDLDGCGLLIELPDGKLLNPVVLPPNADLKAGQQIRFSYKKKEDMMGICMVESAFAEITCLSTEPGSQPPVQCAEINNPFEVPWMDKAMDRHNPVQVIKYKFDGQWGFLFKAIPMAWLYDCDGKLLCESKGDENDTCHTLYLNRFSKGKIIWQGEGIWD